MSSLLKKNTHTFQEQQETLGEHIPSLLTDFARIVLQLALRADAECHKPRAQTVVLN